MNRHLDAKGLKCPLPVLRARKVMRDMAPGDILVVQATDPAAPADFRAFCETTGDELVDVDQGGAVIVITIRRARPAD
ncbi:MAG TPA: sulfurtransferase TusA family protein [Candidatus Cybelea sp.]|nr:sulfurtransferase TusA family protein [Candidatus Cybelea sp.]